MVSVLNSHGFVIDTTPCPPSQQPVLRIIYNIGKGVCIDCEANASQRSGFAFIAVESRDATKQYVSAEWQYWGDGSVGEALDAFARDLSGIRDLSGRRSIGEPPPRQ
jgi:hypothetical protein